MCGKSLINYFSNELLNNIASTIVNQIVQTEM